jgi:hypothetical protein
MVIGLKTGQSGLSMQMRYVENKILLLKPNFYLVNSFSNFLPKDQRTPLETSGPLYLSYFFLPLKNNTKNNDHTGPVAKFLTQQH